MNEVQEFNDFELLNHFNKTCKVDLIIQNGFYTSLLSNYESFDSCKIHRETEIKYSSHNWLCNAL